MQLTLSDVQRALATLSYHFPESGHTATTLKLISADYYEDLKRYSKEVFFEAIKSARRNSQYFPKVKVIIEHCEEAKNWVGKNQTMIGDPSYKSEFDIEKNKRCLVVMSELIARKISVDEAEERLKEIGMPKEVLG